MMQLSTLRKRDLERRHLLCVVGLAMLVAVSPAWGLEVWFVRHAESEFNVVDGPLPVPDEGVTYPLTPEGVRQAAVLGARFTGVEVDYLYSSTRLRTLQTADAISFRTGVPVRLAPAAVEASFGPAPDLGRDVLPIFRRWAEGDTRARASEAAESLEDFKARFLPFWEELVDAYGDDTGRLVLVTHGGVIMFMLPELCPEVTRAYVMERPVGNAEIVKTVLENGQLRCLSWMGEPLTAAAD